MDGPDSRIWPAAQDEDRDVSEDGSSTLRFGSASGDPGLHAAVDELVADAHTPGAAVAELPRQAGTSGLLIMCLENLWWHCHRRLLADHLTLVRGCAVDHLGHDGRRTPHPPTDTVQRRVHDVRYAVDPSPELP